mmetsp:Transcript_13934/g.22166  ORF Transcript_13934/g.22166 Transcript_13934/m.22166 type:complete len:212 (+) Transcript_13934:1853-2488(+)
MGMRFRLKVKARAAVGDDGNLGDVGDDGDVGDVEDADGLLDKALICSFLCKNSSSSAKSGSAKVRHQEHLLPVEETVANKPFSSTSISRRVISVTARSTAARSIIELPRSPSSLIANNDPLREMVPSASLCKLKASATATCSASGRALKHSFLCVRLCIILRTCFFCSAMLPLIKSRTLFFSGEQVEVAILLIPSVSLPTNGSVSCEITAD